jgi:hypothetical protein
MYMTYAAIRQTATQLREEKQRPPHQPKQDSGDREARHRNYLQ